MSAMLTTRVLPSEEWPRLVGTSLETVAPALPFDSTQIIVVEDDGEVVGCWALMTVPYAEGLWIAPKYRKQGPVGLRLWRKMVELVKGLPASAMMTSADTDMMRDLIARRGGVMLPATVHLVPVRK